LRNFRPVRISEIRQGTFITGPRDILILDSMGKLGLLFAMADIVFIGGSLVKKGGHNLTEPARFARAIVFGPSMENFRDMAQGFLKNQAAIKVENESALKDVLVHLISHPEIRTDMGRRAAGIVEASRGAVARVVEKVKSVLGS
jgi:3-deoxy-D-manno-octulosonic-acid transferase